jgi:putative transposase
MARIARVVIPGYPHHITQRSMKSMPIFHSDDDRREYLSLLSEQSSRFGLRFISYCLMIDHIHLIAVPDKEYSLSRALGEAHRQYTRYVNFRAQTKGYLFQGRFQSCPLDEQHLLAGVRYIERNPVRAGIVEKAWEYEWSSAKYHIGLREDDMLICDAELFQVIEGWEDFLQIDPPEIEVLREKTRTGRPCGGEDFVYKAESLTGRSLRSLLPGRPRKQQS